MTTGRRAFHEDRIAQMSSDVALGAYSIGVSDAYGDVFSALSMAFVDGHDIHWLREQIAAQWMSVAPAARGTA
jgi:hypothetical protein